MSIQTNGSGTKYVKWSTPTGGILGLTQKSILIWTFPTTNATNYEILNTYNSSDLTRQAEFCQVSTGSPSFTSYWTGTDGSWFATSALYTLNAWNLYAVTYNAGSTANVPLLYLNGTNVATTNQQPTGSYQSNTTGVDLYVGTDLLNGNINGKIGAVLLYNRILSASEIADAYNSGINANPAGNYVPSQDGLVFRPNLMAAKNLPYASFPGSTLAASNLIYDMVTCQTGVPTGSPLGA